MRTPSGNFPAELIPEPRDLVPRDAAPDTIAGWKAMAGGLLSDPCCAFHRNVEISSRYAWIYRLHPVCFKWAAMAAIASHHVRLVLYPLRLHADASLLDAGLRRIAAEARAYSSMPCVLPS